MMSKITSLFGLLFLNLSFFVYAQEVRQLKIARTENKIKIDGELDEADWATADKANDFWQYFPSDTSFSETKTEVMMIYDDNFVYVGFKCFDPEPGGYVTTSLRRDFRGTHNDAMTIIFDTFQDQTNGMFFGVNPFGVQREALISGISGNDGGSGFDLSWDNKWYTNAKIHDGYWTGEMAIPFKTLRYKEGTKVWNANLYRMDSKTAERSTWGHIPRNQSLISLAFPVELVFEEPLKKPGANIAVIPYVSSGINRNFEAGSDTDYMGNFGGDAKIGVTPSLNLDLTINPDFSQVEVDVQQANITRFELVFPERRQFFIENSDIFASFGSRSIRPFFSRRIGIAFDSVTQLNVQNQINYGARLSGRINEDWRIGVMNMQTAKDQSIFQPGFNYSVLALQRQVFARSNVSFIAINKQATNRLSGDSTFVSGVDRNNYSRVLGLDYNLASDDGRWSGKLFYHRTFESDRKNGNENYAHGASLSYNVQAFTATWSHEVVGADYTPDVGFVPRRDYLRLSPSFEYRMYPNKKVVSHGPGIELEYFRNGTFGKTDHNVTLYYSIDFNNSARFNAGLQNDYTLLQRDFDPTRSGDGERLSADSDYNYSSFWVNFESDRRKKFNYTLEGQVGEFFNGSLASISGDINYRYQPFGLATLNLTVNRIDLPEPYASATILLVGPRFDMTFSKNIFLTTFFQYNNQIDNININARLQYRFKPVSDFFLVYTDNYFPTNFKVKNRALVAKLTYWLNL